MNKSTALRRIASLEQRLADLEEQLATVEEGHQAHSLFDEYDYNQDGLIDSAEWGGTQELFEALDTDMDGVLTPSEVSLGMGNSFSKLASRRASKHKGLARRVLNKKAHNLFEEYDLNMDGVIDTTEWGGSMDAFDALDTNMDSLLDDSEVAMGVGPSFSKLAYGQEYLSPQEIADIMGGTLISKQASRRKAALLERIDRYQALNKIVKAVNGKVLETSEKVPYLKPHLNPESALIAAVQVGGLFWEIVLYVDENNIVSVSATVIGDEFTGNPEQTINHKVSANKNGWEFELAQLMINVAKKFMKKNKLPPTYQSGWLNQVNLLPSEIVQSYSPFIN